MPKPKTLIIAGATGYGAFTANCLESARACLQTPVDGVEIDVQITADGHVIAHHDYCLDPSATRLDGEWLLDRGPALKMQTLKHLQRYDIGRLRPGSKENARHPDRHNFDGARIPTLAAVLETLKGQGAPSRLIYIEIKTDPTNVQDSPDPRQVTDAVLHDLASADYQSFAKIIAFDWRVLRYVQHKSPALATAHLTIPVDYLRAHGQTRQAYSPWWDGVDPDSFGGSELKAIQAHGGREWSPYYTDITTERLAEADALGLKVGPWGLSKHEDIERMKVLGVHSATVSGPAWC